MRGSVSFWKELDGSEHRRDVEHSKKIEESTRKTNKVCLFLVHEQEPTEENKAAKSGVYWQEAQPLLRTSILWLTDLPKMTENMCQNSD